MPNLIFNRRLNQSKSTYSVIVENWLNELRVLGYTLPSESYIIKLNNYVNSDISNLTLMDRFFIQATETIDQAKVSLINPTANKITYPVAPTFTALQGIQGNGTTQYANLNFNLSTDTVNYTLNSNCFGAYSRTELNPATFNCIMGSYKNDPPVRQSIMIPRTVGIGYISNNSLGQATHPAVASSLALLSSRRTGAANSEFWLRGTLLSSQANASTSLPNISSFGLCFNNNGTPALFDTRQSSLFYYGNGNVSILSLYTNFQAFMTDLGTQV